ncbi:hypothetical protein RhiirA5_380076 [Rhizophagus irregularis]|uniref:Uncharacterized protein n=1 Tax=Rhizophagus irregularis TaxID=588596 RepID=A0A2N0P9T4_9GLOM|nr:hypothetical protein RhiirA5_380076 [Rhizophagus irregularis]
MTTSKNLEADVTAKERIILEKTEENNRIWGKFKAQGSENALRNATGGSWRCEDYGIGLQVKEQDDFINEDGKLQRNQRRNLGKNVASRDNGCDNLNKRSLLLTFILV